MEKRIAEVAAMEEAGYCLCESGHEKGDALIPESAGEERRCLECRTPARLVKRDLMTGQEKYESDRERREAEKVMADKRADADQHEEQARQFEGTARNLMRQAEQGRDFADLLRKL